MLSVDEAGPIGVIGCGGVTRATITQLLAAGGVLAWVVDPDAGARAEVVRAVINRGGPAPAEFSSVEDALRSASSGAGGVLVNSPAGLHLDHIRRCARDGHPMLVAKPLARTFSDALLAVEIAAAHGVGLTVAEQYPYLPHAVLVRELISGSGTPNRIHFDHRKPTTNQTTLYEERQTGITEFAVHHYAVLTSWLGTAPEAISVDTWNTPEPQNGSGSLGSAWLRYDLCHVSHSFGFGSVRPAFRLEIEHDEWSATAFGTHYSAPDVAVRLYRDGEAGVGTLVASERLDAWVDLYSDWLASAAHHTPPEKSRALLTVMAMMDAAIRSAEDGAVVVVRGNPGYRGLE